jgi:hypothetical protein
MALFALLLLTAIAMGMMFMADTETAINANFNDTQQAYYAVRAGLEQAREQLRTGAFAPSILPSNTGGVVYLVNPGVTAAGAVETVDPTVTGTYFDDELCHEHFPFGGAPLAEPAVNSPCTSLPSGTGWRTFVNSAALGTGTAAALSFKWVRISLKANNSGPNLVDNHAGVSPTTQVCWNARTHTQVVLPSGMSSCTTAGYTPVYLLTALAVTRSGARRMLQYEVAPVRLPPLPSPLTFDGPASTFTPPYDASNSNNFVVDGSDTATAGTPAGCPGAGSSTPAIGAWDTYADSAISGAIPSNRQDHYTGAQCPSTCPDVQAVDLTGLNTPTMLKTNLVDLVTSTADQVLAGPLNNPTWPAGDMGTDTSPKVTVVQGDLTLSGSTSGSGILLVTGTLTTSGNTSFNGIILVVGEGVWISNGGGSGSINGVALVAHSTDDTGNLLGAMASPLVDWSGGGGNGIHYNSCWANIMNNRFSLTVIATRELML